MQSGRQTKMATDFGPAFLLSRRTAAGATAALAAELLLLAALVSSAGAACPKPKGVTTNWIDPTTPDAACTKAMCTGSYAECSAQQPPTEDMVLIFSDEFSSSSSSSSSSSASHRAFDGPNADARWTAVDLYYSSDFAEAQSYKPENVALHGGAAHITFEERRTEAVLHASGGNRLVAHNYTSAMLQSWNKFCFTGGYVEFSIKLPGNAVDSGLWAAAWMNGNLGRAGHLRSTEGMWPYSYNTCEGSGRLPWSEQPGQAISACKNAKGRGAPEIDVLEYGIFDGKPTFVSTMQLAPVAPPFTSWLLPEPPGSQGLRGLHTPGAAVPGAATRMGAPYGDLNRPGFPRAGTPKTDTFTASSDLGRQHFEGFHRYAVLWEPGRHVRWFLDDALLFEVNADALRPMTNADGQSIGQRLISLEPMYLIINLAMANKTWAAVSPSLKLPAVMSVDHVRVWQRPGALNVGCDPPGFATSDWIACHADDYLSAAEQRAWRLGACSSQDFALLLALGCTAAAVGLGTLALLWLMRRQGAAAAAAAGRLSPAEHKAAITQPGARDAGCYISGDAGALLVALRAARPDLLAVAAAATATGNDVRSR